MDFRLQDVPKSFVSEGAFGTMASCIITYNISLAMNDNTLTTGALTIISLGGLVFVGWLIWLFRKYLSGRKIIAMPRKAERVSETANWILFALWILTSWVKGMCHPVWVAVAWCLLAVSIGYYFYYCNKYGFTD